MSNYGTNFIHQATLKLPSYNMHGVSSFRSLFKKVFLQQTFKVIFSQAVQFFTRLLSKVKLCGQWTQWIVTVQAVKITCTHVHVCTGKQEI